MDTTPKKDWLKLGWVLLAILVIAAIAILVRKDSDSTTEEIIEEPLVARDDRGIPVFAAACESRTYSCADFASKKDAQDVYNTCYMVELPDRHNLDANSNGIACDE